MGIYRVVLRWAIFLVKGLLSVPWIGVGANPSVPQICFDTPLTVVLLKRKGGKSKLLRLVFLPSVVIVCNSTMMTCPSRFRVRTRLSRKLEIWIKSSLLGS